jgi:hypothetical protein
MLAFESTSTSASYQPGTRASDHVEPRTAPHALQPAPGGLEFLVYRPGLFSPSGIPKFWTFLVEIPTSGTEVAQEPQAVPKGTSVQGPWGLPELLWMERSGTPSFPQRGVGEQFHVRATSSGLMS